jgi:hypothetical protein
MLQPRGRGSLADSRIMWAVILAAFAASYEPVRSSPPTLPQRLEKLTSAAKLTADERKRLSGGAPIAKMLDVDRSKEVAVFGAIWINAPVHRYVEAVKDIERFERGGGFKITKRISEPPQPRDFADLHLPKEDVDDLRTCRIGDCELKLGEGAIERFRSEIDRNGSNTAAAADRVMQELALRYANAYLEGGNKRLAVYRDQSRPTFIEQEFRDMIDRMPELTTQMPDIRRYLLEFPGATLRDATSFLYWQETEFGLKPTIRISHVVIREGPDDTAVASKMLYATHYFWTGVELRALLSDPSRGPGFWLATVSRSRSDGLSGFTGTIIRTRVGREVQEGALAALQSTRETLEAASAPKQ